MSVIQSIHPTMGHVLTFDDVKHEYVLDGVKVPGPTTFIKGGYPSSPALFNWYAKTAATAACGLVSEYYRTHMQLPEMGGVIDVAKNAPMTEAKKAANIGSIVHDFAYLFELGEEEKAKALKKEAMDTPDWVKVKNGIDKFLEWKWSNRDVLIATERIVASPDIEAAGKFDRLAYREGVGVVLSDFKTSNGIYVDQFIQIAAYSMMAKDWLDIDVNAYEVLHFSKKNGAFKTQIITDLQERQDFAQMVRTCRDVYAFREKWEKDKRFAWLGGYKKRDTTPDSKTVLGDSSTGQKAPNFLGGVSGQEAQPTAEGGVEA